MASFVWIAVAAQLAMVAAGHFSEIVLNLSGILGTAIPFALGIGYGIAASPGARQATRGGFLIGFVGAVVGVLAAIVLGDQGWTLLTFAPLASGVAGVLGALVGVAAGGGAVKKGGRRGKKGK